MIRLFVFDLGNVILPFDCHPIARQLQRRSRKGSGVSVDEIDRYIFDLEQGFINPYEEGLLSSRQFFEEIKDRYDLDLDLHEFEEIWNNIFRENSEVNDVIIHLKRKGFPLFLLSNTNELHFSHIIERYPIVHEMDEWILSFEVGAKKPKERIYEAIFERIDLSPSEVFYIDDVNHYIEVGRRMGIEGLVFESPAGLWEALKEKGI
jgi:glucose-1-phosphatase